MHRLNELAARLTPAQIREVEDFAEFLAARKPAIPTPPAGRINVDAVPCICRDLGGDATDKQLLRSST